MNSIPDDLNQCSQLKLFIFKGPQRTLVLCFCPSLAPFFEMVPVTAKERFILKAETEEKEFKLHDFSLAASIHLSLHLHSFSRLYI